MKLELVLDEVDRPWEPTAEWIEALAGRLEDVGRCSLAIPAVLQVVLTDDATLADHNREYRNKDAATDVLSFSYLDGHENERDALVRGERPMDDFAEPPLPGETELVVGQVLVSQQTLEARGPLHTTSREAELAFMIVHGLLHVLGHDHAVPDEAQRMREHEIALMRGLGYTLLPLAEVAAESGHRQEEKSSERG